MKLLPSILLITLGAALCAFSAISYVLAPSVGFDSRAVLLLALFVAGSAFEILGVRTLLRAQKAT